MNSPPSLIERTRGGLRHSEKVLTYQKPTSSATNRGCENANALSDLTVITMSSAIADVFGYVDTITNEKLCQNIFLINFSDCHSKQLIELTNENNFSVDKRTYFICFHGTSATLNEEIYFMNMYYGNNIYSKNIFNLKNTIYIVQAFQLFIIALLQQLLSI